VVFALQGWKNSLLLFYIFHLKKIILKIKKAMCCLVRWEKQKPLVRWASVGKKGIGFI
jgi:hypothetical protein